MPKSRIAALLFTMKRNSSNLVSIEGELYSADELLTMYAGRQISEEEGKDFITHDSHLHDSYNPIPV